MIFCPCRHILLFDLRLQKCVLYSKPAWMKVEANDSSWSNEREEGARPKGSRWAGEQEECTKGMPQAGAVGGFTMLTVGPENQGSLRSYNVTQEVNPFISFVSTIIFASL